jgi:hypothetical protein
VRLYCRYCLAHADTAAGLFGIAFPISDRAKEVVASGDLVKTGSITYTHIDHKTTFPGSWALIEFVEMFGDEFMYRDAVGSHVKPYGVTIVDGSAVCVQHIPPPLTPAQKWARNDDEYRIRCETIPHGSCAWCRRHPS